MDRRREGTRGRLHVDANPFFVPTTQANLLCTRRHVAEVHVVDHALPQRRHLFNHGKLLPEGLHKPVILTDRTLGRGEKWPLSPERYRKKYCLKPAFARGRTD